MLSFWNILCIERMDMIKLLCLWINQCVCVCVHVYMHHVANIKKAKSISITVNSLQSSIYSDFDIKSNINLQWDTWCCWFMFMFMVYGNYKNVKNLHLIQNFTQTFNWARSARRLIVEFICLQIPCVISDMDWDLPAQKGFSLSKRGAKCIHNVKATVCCIFSNGFVFKWCSI